MPDFIYNNKVYYNPVEFAMDRIGGAWKMPILWRLREKTMRYGELKKDIPHVTHKMLSSKLKELEEEGFITRSVFAEVPPRVEYTLTKRGRQSIEVIENIRSYGQALMKEFKIQEPRKALKGREKPESVRKLKTHF
ncbi:MAG: helix-turn-helix transcriptional regulator [Bacteroidia bacterium]|nr:helix-turn-helix transcriptional regulator [Bacteroidia bacterium]